jgi:hypothetical protein
MSAARPVATSMLSTTSVSMRAIHRPGPASLPMSSTLSRPSTAQAGTGTGVAVGTGGSVTGPVGIAAVADGRGEKLDPGMAKPVLGSAKMAVLAW